MANKVFVLDTDRKPLDPVHSGYTRRLLKRGEAAVIRRYPFTIILKRRVETAPSPLRLKCDPGSRQTGMALVNDATGAVVFAAEIEHRGQLVKKRLHSRRAIRRSRRHRKTRYRKPRFLNRTRPKGWLPPSLESRVENILTWTRRFLRLCPVQALSQELVKFDLQKMEHPEIAGVQYQQGALAGYELREYLLEKWKRTCAYCGSTNVPLQVEHIVPRANGGTDRASNLTLACEPCNRAKGKLPVEVFLKNRPNVLKKIQDQAKASLKDAAAINAARWKLFGRLKELGLSLEVGSGGLTKFNRTQRNLPKRHWLDAACVGKSTPENLRLEDIEPLQIKAMGHGLRQMCCMDRFGFPRTSAKQQRGHHRVRQFSCWDRHLAMAFAQLTGRDGLRDIEVCLQSQRGKLYRMGFRGWVSHSTLADANANRSFLIYQDFGLHLIACARRLYQHEPFALDLKHLDLTLDSTMIDLCLSVFPWAHFRTTKAAVKAHMLLDLRGSIPTFVASTSARFTTW